MNPLVKVINALPVSVEDENTYPSKVPLKTWQARDPAHRV